MVKVGDALETISYGQVEFATSVKRSLLNDLDNLRDALKEYDRLRKKLESRRLDLDAKNNRLAGIQAKGKAETSEGVQLQGEVRDAREKYDQTIVEMTRVMQIMKRREVRA